MNDVNSIVIIKPCPICGGEITIETGSGYMNYYWRCSECNTSCDNFDTKDDAIRAANMRYIPVEPAKDNPLTCKDCKNYKTYECHNVPEPANCSAFVSAK